MTRLILEMWTQVSAGEFVPIRKTVVVDSAQLDADVKHGWRVIAHDETPPDAPPTGTTGKEGDDGK